MADTAIAKLFTHGRSQAVRVRHVGNGVLLEPIASDVDAWFAELDRFADVPLLDDGRQQPPVPGGEDIFE
jgi:antitoxin VapB